MSTGEQTPKPRTKSWPCARPSVFSMLVMRMGQDCVLHLTGTFDADSVADFQACVADAVETGPRQLVVELDAVEDIDSDGMAALSAARDSTAERGIRLVLDSPPEVATRQFAEGEYFVR